MSQPATIALCTLTGLIVLTAVLQSWKLYRKERASNQDIEAGTTTERDEKFDDDDVWVFGSVASRSFGNIAIEERYAAQVADQPEIDNVHDFPSSSPTSTTSSMEVNPPDTPTSLHSDSQEESDLDVLDCDIKPAPPSPIQIYQAQEVRFLHASLVPVPLRPQWGLSRETCDSCREDDQVETFDVDIHRTSNGDFRLHPHPLRSHPVSIDLPLQGREILRTGWKGGADIRSIQQAVAQDASAGESGRVIEERRAIPYNPATWSCDIRNDKVSGSTRNGKIISARVDSGVLPVQHAWPLRLLCVYEVSRWSSHAWERTPGYRFVLEGLAR